MKTAKRVDEIPYTTHFAVLVEDSYQQDSYHDYDTVYMLNYIAFDSAQELERWIVENNGRKTFKVINAKPVTFELKTTITVSD